MSGAAGGDFELAVLATQAGLTVENTRRYAANPTLDRQTLRMLTPAAHASHPRVTELNTPSRLSGPCPSRYHSPTGSSHTRLRERQG